MYACAPPDTSIIIRGELGLGVRLHLRLVLNRQPSPGLGMVVLSHLLEHTHVMVNLHQVLDLDGPKLSSKFILVSLEWLDIVACLTSTYRRTSNY